MPCASPSEWAFDAGRRTPEMSARYLALGDSYTIGEGVAEHERWPVQLTDLLRQRGIALEAPVIVAKTGWTTDELLDAIEAAAPAGMFDLVTLLVGVNDQYRGRSRAAYEPAFRSALDRAISFARGESARVVVLSIPDWGVTPFAAGADRARIAREIDDFNAANRSAARAAGARYADVAPSSRRAAGDPSLLAADGLHPSARLYAEWARLVMPEATAALGTARR